MPSQVSPDILDGVKEAQSLIAAQDAPLALAPAIRDALPALAREMIQVMGEEPTLKLIAELGGVFLVVPETKQRRSPRFERLAEIVGTGAATAFVARWGGVEIQVPRCAGALRMLRNRSIVQGYSAGRRPGDLARQFGLTERHVFKILKQPI